jgi:hypothetical protein
MITTKPLRQSAIATAACLKRFHEIQDLGLEDESVEARRGSAFHHIALREYVPALLRVGRDQDLEELEGAFRRGIVAARCPPHLVGEVEDLVFSWGRGFALNRSALLTAEERQADDGIAWTPDLSFAYRATPRGSVLRVEDLKTYFAVLSEEAVREEFQGQFYIWRAMKAWPGFDVYEFAMTFVRYGVTTVVEYSPAELARLERNVLATLDTIADARARNDWPAQAGDHCGFCRLKCEIADDPRVLERRITAADEAPIVASRLAVLERMIKSDREALKAWTMTEGPVVIGGLEFAHRPVERVRYDAALVFDRCKAHQVPPPALTFSKSALRSLIGTKKAQRAWPGLVEAIGELATVKTSSRFGAKKVGNLLEDEEEDDAASE